MTKEELKNKCKERAKIFQQAMESCHSNNPIDCIEWFADKIIELEAENEQIKNSDTLCKLIGEQKRKITELEAQVTDMKNYCCEVSKYLHDYSGVNSSECRKRDILLIKELKLCEKWGDLI